MLNSKEMQILPCFKGQLIKRGCSESILLKSTFPFSWEIRIDNPATSKDIVLVQRIYLLHVHTLTTHHYCLFHQRNIVHQISKGHLGYCSHPIFPPSCTLIVYESFSDVGDIRVWFASKILTPCRMHWNAFLIAQIIAKCHSFPNMYGML